MSEHGKLWLPHLVIEWERMQQHKWSAFAVFVSNDWLHNCTISFNKIPVAVVIPRDSSFSHLD
jgi:hypothetical protein